jgi:hypothetical protein
MTIVQGIEKDPKIVSERQASLMSKKELTQHFAKASHCFMVEAAAVYIMDKFDLVPDGAVN